MIKTKTEEERENKIRAEIEDLTREIIQRETKLENYTKRIDRLPASRIENLKEMVDQREMLHSYIE